jgi:hypothetical protein
MSNIKPTPPSFVFGYWRPWKEDTNFFDSYLDYVKDKSLVKYGADTVGKYIRQASIEQVNAINNLGQAIGQGMNVLSNQLAKIDSSLGFINRNLEVQIEQQRISNLLLEDIKELMWVPDSEKVRQNCIELGLKFFAQAQSDDDLYEDALQELRKAEEIKKQDYFVLFRIGLIYLYSPKHIDVPRALQYFENAAKYSTIENDSTAFYLANKLMGKFISRIDKLQIKHAGVNKLNLVKLLNDNLNCGLNEVMHLVNNIEKEPLNIESSQLSGKNIEIVFKVIQDCGAVVEAIRSPLKSAQRVSDDKSGIEQFISEIYSNAAFASYIIGDDEKAIKYQAMVLSYQNIPIAKFTLAKYQLRNGNKEEAIKCLDIAINESPELLLGVFKEIDFVNEPAVINLIVEKNDKIDKKIKEEAEKWKKIESTLASNVLKELTELSQQSYEIKVSEIKTFEKRANDINNNIGITESKIGSYISEIKKTTFCTLDANDVQTIINELLKAKDLPLEKMLEVIDKIKKQVDANRIKIGSKYAGGIVFYIDKTGNHGLVCAEEDFGEAIYCYGEFTEAIGNGIFDGSGMENTKKIVNYASSKVGLFGKKKVITAARLCLESNHKGYNDWYLPTIKEFDKIRNLKKVNLKKGCGYWSSTIKNGEIKFWNFAVDTSQLFAINETFGIRVKSNGVARNTLLKVLAVRAF